MKWACGLLLSVFLLVGCNRLTQKPNPSNDSGTPAAENSADYAAGKKYSFGEAVALGDLRATVLEVRSEQLAGHFLGEFRTTRMMLVHLSIENTSRGKIADWPGWQGTGRVEDEHGNLFKPVELRGWSYLPDNDTIGGGWKGDFATRIHPGTTYENAAYYEYAPSTSKQVVVTLAWDGRKLQFQGPIGPKTQLDHEKALRAKAGQILDANDLIKAIRAGRTDTATSFPIDCTMRAKGVVAQKIDQTKTRPDRKDLSYMVWISYEPGKPLNNAASAICYTADKAVFDRVKVGDIISLQGTLKSVPDRQDAKSPIQAHIFGCVEAK